jgi:hypothetical protein
VVKDSVLLPNLPVLAKGRRVSRTYMGRRLSISFYCSPLVGLRMYMLRQRVVLNVRASCEL